MRSCTSPAWKTPVDVGARAAVRNDVAVGIEIDLAAKDRGVRNMADGDEEAVDVALPDFSVSTLRSFTPVTRCWLDVVDVFDHGIGEELDLRIAARAIQHDLRSAESIAAMHQGHFSAEAREEVGLFHGGIAAAHHHDLLAAIKESVAGGAGADAVADQLLFVGQIRASAPTRRRR